MIATVVVFVFRLLNTNGSQKSFDRDHGMHTDEQSEDGESSSEDSREHAGASRAVVRISALARAALTVRPRGREIGVFSFTDEENSHR